MKKYAMEFIGTFFLVLSIVMAVNGGAGALAPVAIGATLMAVIFAGGHVSGAHYNPAVTLAIWMRGKCETKDVAPYIVAQIVAASCASLTAGFLLSGVENAITPIPMNITMAHSLVAEFLGTFLLAFVILNVATAKGTAGNSFYGLAIGFTVTGMAYSLGGVSGGAFNPAVALGVSIAEMHFFSNIWIFLVSNFAGGALAALAFKAINTEEEGTE